MIHLLVGKHRKEFVINPHLKFSVTPPKVGNCSYRKISVFEKMTTCICWTSYITTILPQLVSLILISDFIFEELITNQTLIIVRRSCWFTLIFDSMYIKLPWRLVIASCDETPRKIVEHGFNLPDNTTIRNIKTRSEKLYLFYYFYFSRLNLRNFLRFFTNLKIIFDYYYFCKIKFLETFGDFAQTLE